jgi:hypothetical protein
MQSIVKIKKQTRRAWRDLLDSGVRRNDGKQGEF